MWTDRCTPLVDLDPAVRRGLPDLVHRMRVTCRRLRSTPRSYRAVLEREVTDPIREELKWLGGELGAERDQEVLVERLGLRIGASLHALVSPRYLGLLNSLAMLTQQPPPRRKAARKPEKVMVKAILKEYGQLAGQLAHALELSPGTERDAALHQARKAAKKARYATEPARASLGKPAKRLAKGVKAVQKVLGDHQDTVVARDALRHLALAAQAAGEPGVTWGLLYGQEQALAEGRERELPTSWADASKPGLRKALVH